MIVDMRQRGYCAKKQPFTVATHTPINMGFLSSLEKQAGFQRYSL
jgi:hypothetical protein